MMTTLEDDWDEQVADAYARESVRVAADLARIAGMSEQEATLDRLRRDEAIRRVYLSGNATLAELAKATGLSKQRIHMIVKDGGEE
jgi:hypothetical protein